MNPAKVYDVFLSYHNADRDAAEALARRLRQERLEPFLDRWYLIPGRPWLEALEEALTASCACVVLLGPQGLGRWQRREMWVALDRQAHDPTFSVIPVLLPGGQEVPSPFLACNTWVDLRRGVDDETAFHRLLAGIRGEPPGPEMAKLIALTVRPYVGLRAFREEDARFFCGREEFTTRLVEAVGRSSFLAVVGASGSGKSSVVRAGLVPALRRGEVEGGTTWEVAVFTPGDSPLRRLAAPLVALLEPEMSEVDRLAETTKLADYLREGRVSLGEVVERVLEKQPGTERLLLVADQFEELFTLCRDETERGLFLEQLLAATANRGPVTALLTLRGDFYGRCLEHRALADRLDGRVVNLGPMEPEELRRAIVEPAEAAGLRFEPGLAERILEDVAEEPGGLPLLEFALTELWERRRAGLLTHEAYEQIGGVAGAIARRAEAEYDCLNEEEKQLARRVFLRLVAPGERTEDTRRRATLAELGKEARPVVKALADARLVTTGRDEATGQETVEVAHEALIRGWERLRGWVDEDREFLTWRKRLEVALREWQRLGRDEGALLRGRRLAEAKRWLAARRGDLSSDERTFIQASIVLQERGLEQLNQFKSRLISNLSHELLTPVARVNLCLALLRKEQSTAERRERYLQALEEEAARLEKLIKDLLALSLLETGTVRLKKEWMDVVELVQQVLLAHQPLAESKGIEVSSELPADLPPLEADRDGMVQLLTNLLSNALNYTPQGGKVTVRVASAWRDDRLWLTLAVQDTGPGIPLEERERIFDRFYRGKEARRKVPGTGLGLSIVKKILALHDGFIELESEVGGGSTFTAWLPLGE